ncbi:DUF1684 domain-containing protein [Peterkaempfera bronchialis]|uniref:DUF1684 domain-containing protein n=1 Tax=Peterkaempfera bronchialis TaxID=2126346 RepID=A0A345T2C8_9ACTN|nr:DUF1684 domain-containing protein [Peterkaempfera bronchialis]AXI80133.1 DUF1684 domain-containing protein [Peterkaempfera bronchialis]
MTTPTSTTPDAWNHWRDTRVAAAAAPYGPLALTGTHWLAEPPATPAELPDVPGRWSAGADGTVVLTAVAADGLIADGAPVDGTVRLRPDTDPAPSVAEAGERRLIPIAREGVLAVRVYDPAAPARAAFAGIDAYDWSAAWVVPARFTPYDDDRTVAVPNADGKQRALALAGEIAFDLGGETRTLTVGRTATGLSAVFGDATSGRETYRFRFLTLPAPDADGRTTLDLNRAHLPPCAFADHFICPFPPPGNVLPIPVQAGEKNPIRR